MPVFPLVTVEHPLLMSLRNLPPEYRFNNPTIRAAIIRYLHDKLGYDLNQLGMGIELIELSSPGRLAGRPHALPLRVKIRAPSDIADFSLSYVLQVLRDANPQIMGELKKLERDYRDGNVSFETYSFDDLMGMDTLPPSPCKLIVWDGVCLCI